MSEPSGAANGRLGIEITSTTLNAAVVGKSESVIETHSTAITDAANVVSQVVDLATGMTTRHGAFAGVGIAVPGLVDRASGRVAYSANIPEHSNIDLGREVSSAIGVDVFVENDANAAAYGEYRSGAGRGSRNLFYATLGEGVGGAFIFNGEIWRGASGYAGEFGYVTINSEGMRLEEVASAASILRRTRSRFHQDSTSSLNKLGEEGIRLGDIIAAAAKEDDFAQMMLGRTGVYVGSAIASVINLLNIEKIVIGGAIMEAKHIVLDAIIERAKEFSFAPAFDSTSIVEGELGPSAAAIGAAYLSRQST
ncbi:MAG: ROK family protein [Chloracidobacterium sp.]|nr:ROK family protein [Chloracidobacterium sp.]